MPSSEQQDAAAAAAGEGSTTPLPSREEQEELLQQLHEQLEQLIDDRQDDLRAAFKQLGLPEPDLDLGGNPGDDSSRQKQLTGR
jgi:hypothetical protein